MSTDIDQFIEQHRVPAPPPSKMIPASAAKVFELDLAKLAAAHQQQQQQQAAMQAAARSAAQQPPRPSFQATPSTGTMPRPIMMPAPMPAAAPIAMPNPMAQRSSICSMNPGLSSSPMSSSPLDATLIPGLNAPVRGANIPQAAPAPAPAGSLNVTLASRSVDTPTIVRDIPPNRPVRIGRALPETANDPFFLGYANKVVSRSHGEISLVNGELFYKDLGSSSGSFLNNARLAPHQAHKIRPGDVLQLGVDYVDPVTRHTTKSVQFEFQFGGASGTLGRSGSFSLSNLTLISGPPR